nr:Na+/H+ antiporter NhaA [Micromonospora globispora]
MLAAAFAALVAANTPLAHWYEEFWTTRFVFTVGGFGSLSSMDLRHRVNDPDDAVLPRRVAGDQTRAGLRPSAGMAGGPDARRRGGRDMVVPAALFLTVNSGGAGEPIFTRPTFRRHAG